MLLNTSIACLQETYWDEELIETVSNKWNGLVFCNNFNNNTISRGTAILFTDAFLNKISIDVKKDSEGRILSVKFTHKQYEQKINIISVYAPNNDCDRANLYLSLYNYVDQNYETIICGDFNEIMDPVLDQAVGMNTFCPRNVQKLKDFLEFTALIDLWRDRNSDRREFTRRQFVNGCLKQSRIDYFFVSRKLLEYIVSCYIKHYSYSDHDLLLLKVEFGCRVKGPGLFIHNNTHLKDSNYVQSIEQLIISSKDCPLYENEIRIWWDNLKYKLKCFAKEYGQSKHRNKFLKQIKLEKDLKREYSKLSKNHNHDQCKLKELELEEINRHKC
ncbi:hypothetical protein SNE40_020489 [Patella caerulea]|uniref:exodeoxyribonuclease III n=1 Tax=Patella caerulea TaxID=87958 RepID=A0AAN8G4L0_PATCE